PDHLTIGDRVMVAARGALHRDTPDRAIMAGCPAVEIGVWRRYVAGWARLTGILRRTRGLEKQMEDDEEKGAASQPLSRCDQGESARNHGPAGRWPGTQRVYLAGHTRTRLHRLSIRKDRQATGHAIHLSSLVRQPTSGVRPSDPVRQYRMKIVPAAKELHFA